MRNPFNKKPRNDYEPYDEGYDSGFYRGDDEDDGVVGDFEDDMAALPPRKSAGGSNKLKVVKPREYQEGPQIADYLASGNTVVMNIEELERASALRLIDFLLGALHVLGGEFRRVTKTTLVLSPRSGELSADDDRSSADEEEEI